MPLKILVVYDSALVRQMLLDILEKHQDVEVQVAPDPIIAQQRIAKEWPDVMILDIEMPRMDGLAFLQKIQKERPTPVIICSGQAQQGSPKAIQALELGAFAVLAKPTLGIKNFLQDTSEDLWTLVQAAAQSKPATLCALIRPKNSPDLILSPPHEGTHTPPSGAIIALGCSTGGTLALESILTSLPRNLPGIVIVQHMPESFTSLFARRLNQISELEVHEAKDGERIRIGYAYIAPGGKHLLVKRHGDQYRLEVLEGPLVSRHRPSVDVLFRSVAKAAGSHAIGIIMTGMGDDGAHGLLEMKQAGARTYAQDEESCVVFGMPKEAIRLGAVDHVIPLSEVAKVISNYAK